MKTKWLISLFVCVVLSSCAARDDQKTSYCSISIAESNTIEEQLTQKDQFKAFAIKENNIQKQEEFDNNTVLNMIHEHRLLPVSVDIQGTFLVQLNHMLDTEGTTCRQKQVPPLNLMIEQEPNEIATIYYVADQGTLQNDEVQYPLNEQGIIDGFYLLVQY